MSEHLKEKINKDDLIYKLSYYHQMNNDDLFYSNLKEYLNQLPSSNKYKHKLNSIILNTPKKLNLLKNKELNTYNIFEVIDTINNDYVFIEDNLKEVIDNIIFEYKNKDIFLSHNLKTRNKILLYGDTGNGKTTLARYISKLFNLPFVNINSDSLIEGKLGETSSRINKIFSNINEPCVMFIDEIDSIARSRNFSSSDSTSGAYENERITNSLLINLEKLSDDVIFICASNRKDVLDSAFLRRLDIIHEVKNPDEISKIKFTEDLLKYHNQTLKEFYMNYRMNFDFSKYKNFSDLKIEILNYLRKNIKNKILNGQIINSEMAS